MYISFKKSMVSTLRSRTNKHEKGIGKYSQKIFLQNPNIITYRAHLTMSIESLMM